MVDRYDPWFDGWDGVVVMDVEDDGDWVSYDDYKALKDAADKLLRVIEDVVDYHNAPNELVEAVNEYRKATK